MSECGAFPCQNKDWAGNKAEATHTVKVRVIASEGMPEWIKETEYCVSDAMYFASWLPYAYRGEYELVSIEPPFEEWWPKDER